MAFFIFCLWLVLAGIIAQPSLSKFLPLSKLGGIFFGSIISFLLLGLVSNIFTAWLAYDFWIVAFCGALISVFWLIIRKRISAWPDLSNNGEGAADFAGSWPKSVWLGFFVLVISGFVSIFLSSNGNEMASPWLALPVWQLVLVISGFLFIFLSIDRKISPAKMLAALMFFSLLVHGYLLVYDNGFGADRFRHLGSENRLIQGLEYQPSLLAEQLWLKRLGPIAIPQALIDRAKVSYGFQWTLESFVSQVSGIGTFQVNRFLLPLLWSLGLTFFAYLIGLMVFSDKRKALLSATFCNGFYLLQYYGAQGLPASYGVLVLAAGMIFWLAWLNNSRKELLAAAVAFTVLAYFNYSLSFLLLAAFGGLALFVKRSRAAALYFSIVAVIALIAAEIMDGNKWQFAWGKIWGTWSYGNLAYYNSLSRLSDLWGTSLKPLDFIVAVFFVLLVFYCLIKIAKSGNKLLAVLALAFMATIAAYCFSWVFLQGEHSLSRRLTLFSAWFLVFILADSFGGNLSARRRLAMGVVLSLFFAVSYFSGPVLGINISDRDWSKAQAIWNDIRIIQPRPCIDDDLEVILSLEAVSAKEFQEDSNNASCAQRLRQ